MAIRRTASAKWSGSLQKGQGEVSTQSQVLNSQKLNFASRFADGQGTNPEELIAAAHAGCFSMALSGLLDSEGFEISSISTSATVSVDKQQDGWGITSSHLETEAEIDGISEDAFRELAEKAKDNCPVSKALGSIELSLDARLSQKGKNTKVDQPTETPVAGP